MIAFAIQSPAPPFPALVLGYAINGFGVALQVSTLDVWARQSKKPIYLNRVVLQDAGANGFVASLKDNSSTKMGILHAVYG